MAACKDGKDSQVSSLLEYSQAYPLTKIYSICKQDNNVGNQCKKSSSIYTGITYRSYFALLDELFTEMHTAL